MYYCTTRLFFVCLSLLPLGGEAGKVVSQVTSLTLNPKPPNPISECRAYVLRFDVLGHYSLVYNGH